MARIQHCCGCGIGWQLQLQFNPQPGNLHMPRVALKKQNKTKQKTFENVLIERSQSKGTTYYTVLFIQNFQNRAGKRMLGRGRSVCH